MRWERCISQPGQWSQKGHREKKKKKKREHTMVQLDYLISFFLLFLLT